jgi:MraZ protein
MFMGQYDHSLDEKGRLTIPSKFRESLGPQFVVSKGLDGCLYAYPLSEWEKIGEKLNSLPNNLKEVRKFKRFFMASATTVDCDKQGRVLLSASLREYAGLEKDATLVGMNDRIEIWDTKKFTDDLAVDDDEMDAIAEKMQDLGFGI